LRLRASVNHDFPVPLPSHLLAPDLASGGGTSLAESPLMKAILRATCLLATLAAAARPAAAAPAAPAGEADRETDAAEGWVGLGVGVPLGAAALFGAATYPRDGGTPAVWQAATSFSLLGLSVLWGTSAGYYRAGLPRYATLSGLGKSALITGAVLLDLRASAREAGRSPAAMKVEEDDGMPVFTVLACGAVIAWDLWDFFTLETSVRERHPAALVPVPTVSVSANRVAFGLAGRF
jgi:hypothetical protein